MSIATQISRLQGLRNRIVTKLTSLGLLSGSGNDLEDCTNAVEAIGGTKAITDTSQTDVASYQYAQVTDANLRSGNIVSGITILGVTGTASMNPPSVNLQTKNLYYGGTAALPSSITPSSGYDGISAVYIERTDANPMLLSSNIKSGVTIMGVTGNYGAQQSKSPSLSSLITQGITSHNVSIIPDTNYLLSRVTIPQITSDIDSNITPDNIKSGVTILGVTGTLHHLQNKNVTLGASMPSTQTPTSPYDGLSQVSFSLDSNVVKAENIKNGVSILGVTGNYIGTTGVADLRSTGNPASWNTARDTLTIDLDETVSGFSSSNILSLCGYNITMGNYPSSGSFSAFDGKISSFYIVGANTSKAVLVDYNNEKLVPTDVSIDCDSYDGQRIYIKISNESALFMGAYMIALVYSK